MRPGNFYQGQSGCGFGTFIDRSKIKKNTKINKAIVTGWDKSPARQSRSAATRLDISTSSSTEDFSFELCLSAVALLACLSDLSPVRLQQESFFSNFYESQTDEHCVGKIQNTQSRLRSTGHQDIAPWNFSREEATRWSIFKPHHDLKLWNFTTTWQEKWSFIHAATWNAVMVMVAMVHSGIFLTQIRKQHECSNMKAGSWGKANPVLLPPTIIPKLHRLLVDNY